MFKKWWKKIKRFFSKKRLNNVGYRLYHKFRKNKFTDKFENQDDIKKIPTGALLSIFGSNVLTENYQNIFVMKGDTPTHSAIYYGGGSHKIAEADIYYSFNKLERYAHKKVVAHYFKNLTIEEVQEIKRRMCYLVEQKYIYDIRGYGSFLISKIPWIKKVKILQASDTTVFCSDGNGVIYHADETHKNSEIAKWEFMTQISEELDPNKITPAHIYIFMENLHKIFPEKIGRIELIPKK